MASWQSSPFAGAAIDFSAIGNIADDYYRSKDQAIRRDAMALERDQRQQQFAQSQADRNAMKEVASGGLPRDAQGNPDYYAAAERLYQATGNADAANKVMQLGVTSQRGQADPSVVREYQFYDSQERAAGREPMSFADFRQKQSQTEAPSTVREWEYFNSLSPEQKQQFLTMKRAQPWLNLGTEHAMPNPVNPGEVSARVSIDNAGKANAEKAGTISEVYDPQTGRKQKVVRNADGTQSPYGGVEAPTLREADRGTATELYDANSGDTVRTIGRDLAGAEAEKVRGRTQAEGEAALPKMRNAMAEYEIKNRSLLGDPGVQGDPNRPAVQGTIDRAISQSSAWTTGLIGSQLAKVPGTPAHDLSKTILEIQANLGFDTLQQMRDNSPTGGALGQVTERELELLQSTWASLQQSQTDEQLVYNLNRIKQIKQEYAALKRQAYQADVARFGRGAVPNPETGRVDASSGAPAAPGPQQRGAIPPSAVQDLVADPSPEAIREFDEVFGSGSANRYLQAR